MVIAFFVWTVLAILFVGLGILTRKSKKPVSFFANVKAPKEVTDVAAYNKAVSRIWFSFAALLELLALPFLVLEQNSPLFILIVLGVMFLSIGITIAYTLVELKYKKK